eukprot:3127268-Rhodomonas_salina.1
MRSFAWLSGRGRAKRQVIALVSAKGSLRNRTAAASSQTAQQLPAAERRESSARPALLPRSPRTAKTRRRKGPCRRSTATAGSKIAGPRTAGSGRCTKTAAAPGDTPAATPRSAAQTH